MYISYLCQCVILTADRLWTVYHIDNMLCMYRGLGTDLVGGCARYRGSWQAAVDLCLTRQWRTLTSNQAFPKLFSQELLQVLFLQLVGCVNLVACFTFFCFFMLLLWWQLHSTWSSGNKLKGICWTPFHFISKWISIQIRMR